MWYKIENAHLTINILAKPHAKQTTLLSVTDQALIVSIHAKPHHGAANIELIEFLSKLFHQPKTQISLIRGQTSRHKQIKLPLTDSVQELLNDPTKFAQ